MCDLIDGTLPDLTRLEAVIKVSEKSFLAAGRAIMEIKHRRLWKLRFDTEEEYWQKHWGWSANNANHNLKAAEVTQQLDEEGCSVGMDSAREARALSLAPKGQRKKIAESIKGNGGRITERKVRAMMKPDDQVDPFGRKIPDECVAYWLRKQDARDLINAISNVRCALAKARQNEDLMFAEIFWSFDRVIGHLDQAYEILKTGMPYAVCPVCQGRPSTQTKGECRMCLGRGLVSEYRWKNTVPEEIRQLVMAGGNS